MDHVQQNESTESTCTTKQKDDKLPHDASVFVGSLPSNIDQGDLTKMLLEHLSEHTQIKNIKVVRDSKGGVCAFVQCEDASSAAVLIETLQLSPTKPFMGRILRYEPARAFRTLLISYRTPTQSIRPSGLSPPHRPALAGEELELELPAAIRIWKHRNSRFHSILYNAEAVLAHDEAEQSEPSSAGHENVFFVNPIRYDAEALASLTSFFGPLDSFGNFDPNKDNQEPSVDLGQYPPPHNAPRSACMDSRCWEVKWEHRDDCVSALMTLRRIPHVTATWAHQPSITPSYQPQPYARNNGSPAYGMHVQQRLPGGYPFMPPQNPYNPQFMQPSQPFQSTARGQHQRGLSHPYFGRALAERMPHQSWDRYALQVDAAAQHVGSAPKTCYQGRPGFPSIKLGSQTAEAEEPSSPDPEGQELFMPQTPALDSSSITPVTPGSQFPITPTTGSSYERFGPQDDGIRYKAASDREVDPTTLFVGGLEMTGPSAWDEDRVKSFFSRFGGLESVKVVRPANAAAAFAFVKFNNPESPARAVFEEHNRVYDGRAMRVQLRDVNPTRGNWKFNRGRGKFPHQQQYNANHRLNSRPPLEVQDKNLSPFNNAGYNDHGLDGSTGITMSSLANALPLGEAGAESETAPAGASATSGNDGNDGSDPPRYREWYDDLQSPVATPELSSLSSSASATGVPYTAPSYQYPPAGGYYPPAPWMPPYMPPGPYPMPYYAGYPAYHPPAHPQQPTSLGSTSSSDASSPTPVGQPVWPGMGAYGSFIPYPVMPPRSAATGQTAQTPTVPQAPVVPAGFIHNEQGTLIAVYQPEALNQYMAVAGPNSASAPATNGDGSQRLGPRTPSLSRSYEHSPVPATPPHQPHRGASTSAAMPDHRYPGFQGPPMPFRHIEGNFMTPGSPSVHRRPHNRPFQQNFNGVRNPNHGYNNSRAFNGRTGRGFVQNAPSPATGRLAYDWAR